MQYRFTPYTGLLFLSGLVTISLGVYTLIKYRHAKGAKSFAVSMFIVTLWSIPNALEMAAAVLDIKLFYANIQYIAYGFSPVILLLLCLEFTGHEKFVELRKNIWLFIIPMITIALVWTDKYHGLVRYNIHLDYSSSFPVIRKQYGPYFYFHAFYSHCLNIITLLILLRAVFIRKTIYRKQVVALILGTSLIVVPNLLYITGLSPIKGYDITPIFFGPAGIIMFWSMVRYRMFDLVPLARATLIENMEAGVMVMDMQDRIIDVNPAFADILGLPIEKVTTKNASDICAHFPKLLDAVLDRSVSREEFDIVKPDESVVYEALLSILKDKNGRDIGRLVVIYDITEKKKHEKEYYEQQWRLAVKNERNRMARDLHDNLGQVLGFINLQAQAVQKVLMDTGAGQYSKKLDKLVEAAQTAHQQIREYIHDIRNSDLIEMDFIAALDKEITNYELQTAIKVTRKITPMFSNAVISPGIRIHILNIIKEALNNVRKHAKADNVLLVCDIEDNNLEVLVRDDGIGFEHAGMNYETKKSYGLNIMKERTSEMGGTLEIMSEPGKGSTIRLRVPLKKEELI